MLLKIYETQKYFVQTPSAIGKENKLDIECKSQQLHLIDHAEDVIVHQGNYCLPESHNTPVHDFNGWGPAPQFIHDVRLYGLDDGPETTVRVVDYTRNGVRHRALIAELCYVCNDEGKTYETLKIYSGAKLG